MSSSFSQNAASNEVWRIIAQRDRSGRFTSSQQASVLGITANGMMDFEGSAVTSN
jgi:hypothetical protein